MTDTIESLRQQLAECQATNGKLLEALKRLDSVAHISCGSVTEALALPNDDTALNELIAERTANLTAEVERLKTVPMKYRRMQFNAQLQDEIESLKQQNAELTAQRDVVMKDAERYRWLRSEHAINDPMASVVWKRNYDRKESEWVNTSDVHSLDRAIDSAIAKGKE